MHAINSIYRTITSYSSSYSEAEFQEKLETLPWDEKEARAKELISRAPTDMLPQKLVSLVFNTAKSTRDLPYFLSAICDQYQYTLSPLEIKMQEIVEDVEIGNFRKGDLEDLNQEEKDLCIQVADRFSHPHIYSKDRYIKEFETFIVDPWKGGELIDELIADVPEGITPRELVEVFFVKHHSTYVPLLMAVVDTYGFDLSPFDTIRLMILEDNSHKLTNEELHKVFQDSGLSEEEKQACYDLAYRTNHPHLYRPASKTIPPSAYNLNFLWINNEPQDREQDKALHIFGEGNGEENFIAHLSTWAEAHPEGNINLWYDSALVTEKARQGTFDVLKTMALSKGVNIQLRDIRKLPNIPDEIARSLHPAILIYYRVDALKALIADYLMTSSEDMQKYIVISDIDIKAMKSEKLFDERTLYYVAEYGYVFNKAGNNHFENSFFIFDRDNHRLQKIHRETIIEELNRDIKRFRSLHPTDYKGFDSQSVFRKYPKFRDATDDPESDPLAMPRKITECPISSFSASGRFYGTDHQTAKWRFIGESNIPAERKKQDDRYEETSIPHLRNWKADHLPDLI